MSRCLRDMLHFLAVRVHVSVLFGGFILGVALASITGCFITEADFVAVDLAALQLLLVDEVQHLLLAAPELGQILRQLAQPRLRPSVDHLSLERSPTLMLNFERAEKILELNTLPGCRAKSNVVLNSVVSVRLLQVQLEEVRNPLLVDEARDRRCLR